MHGPCAIACCWCFLGLCKLAILLPGVLVPRQQWKLVSLWKGPFHWKLQLMVCEACLLVIACTLTPEAMRPMTPQHACLQSSLWAVLVGIHVLTETSAAKPKKNAQGVHSCSALAPAGYQEMQAMEMGSASEGDQEEEEQDLTETRPYCSTCTDSRTSMGSWAGKLSMQTSGVLESIAAEQPAAAANIAQSLAALLGLARADAANGSVKKQQTASVYMKIPWAEPEDLAADWEATLQERVVERSQGHVLVTGTTVRRGCIELVIDLVRTGPDAAADPAGAGAGPAYDEAARTLAGPLAQLMAESAVQDASNPALLTPQLQGQGAEAGTVVRGAAGTAAGAGAGNNWEDDLIDALQPQDWVHWLYLQPPRDAEVLVQACGRAFVTSWDGTQWATRELPRGLGPDGQPLPPVLPKILDVAPACLLVPEQEPLLMLTPVEQDVAAPPSSPNCCIEPSVPKPLTIKLTGPLLDQPDVKITARFHSKYLAIEPAPLPLTASSNASALDSGAPAGATQVDQRSLHHAAGPNVTVPFLVRGIDQPGMLLLECWSGKLLTSRKQLVVVDQPLVATELEAYYNLQASEANSVAGPSSAASVLNAPQPAVALNSGVDHTSLGAQEPEAKQHVPKLEVGKGQSTHSPGESPQHTMSAQHMQQQMSGYDRTSDDLMTDLGCWVEYMAAMQQMRMLQGRQVTGSSVQEIDSPALLAAAGTSHGASTASQLSTFRESARTSHASDLRPSLDGLAKVGTGTGAISQDDALALLHTRMNTSLPGDTATGTGSTGPVSKRLNSTASLSTQLLHASRHPAYQAQMQEVGIQLLEHCCSCAWHATAEMLLADLLALGMPYSRIKSDATTSGMTLLHRAVCSGSQRMVQAVVGWGTEHGDPWNWSEADPANGITPLHVAAVVPTAVVRMHASMVTRGDKGTLADWILQEYEAAWQYWHGATDATGSTPADIAEAHAGGEVGTGGLPTIAFKSEGFLAAIVASAAADIPVFEEGGGSMDDEALVTVDGGFGSELTTLAITLASHEVNMHGHAFGFGEYAQDLSPDRKVGSSADNNASPSANVAAGEDSGDGDDTACPAHLLRTEALLVQQQWTPAAAGEQEGSPGGQVVVQKVHVAAGASRAAHAAEAEVAAVQLLPHVSAGPAQPQAPVAEMLATALDAGSEAPTAAAAAAAAGASKAPPKRLSSERSSNTESSQGSQKLADSHAQGPKRHAAATAAGTEQLAPDAHVSELRQRAARKAPMAGTQQPRGASTPLLRVSSGGSSNISATSSARGHKGTSAPEPGRRSRSGSERVGPARKSQSGATAHHIAGSPVGEDPEGLALSDPAGLFVLLRATLLFFRAAKDEESYCVWVAQRRVHSAQLMQVIMTIMFSVAIGYELGVGGVRGCVTIFAYAVPWAAMWAVRRKLSDNSQVQAKLLAEPMSVMLLLWGVAVRSFQAAGLLPAPHTLGGLLPVGTDCIVEVVVHTLLQVRLPNMLLPRCLYVLASAALYIRLGLAASTAHALAMVGIYNLVAIMTCAAVDFRNRCSWAAIHGVPGISAPPPQPPSSATHAAGRKLY